jgi:peptide/nickel transport system substrate-binding protein
MDGQRYWQRLGGRVSRRRALGVTAAGAGAAFLAACGKDENKTGSAASTSGSTATAAAQQRPSATAGPRTTFEAAKTKGGTLRYFGFDALPLDTMDPHQTQFGPMYNLHSMVFSKLLMYVDQYTQEMAPDLAAAMPETPDRTTYVVKLNPSAKYHNKPPLNGRQVTADDVKYSIERQTSTTSPKKDLYYRRHQWETVDKIETPDATTVRITTKAPTAPFMHYMSDSNAFIIGKELVGANDEMNAPDKMIGSGPFMLDRFEALKIIRYVRNPAWFNADQQGFPTGRPFLDAVEAIWDPQDDNAKEAAFKAKQVDATGFTDKNVNDRLKGQTPAYQLVESPTSGGLHIRLFVADGPWKDPRLRQALQIAVDRQAMGQGLFQQFFRQSAAVSWPVQRWALPQEELLKKPGYRVSKADRDADLAEAKKLGEAGGGPALGEQVMWYAGVPGTLPAYFPQLQKNFQDALGLRFRGELDPTGYTSIGQGLLENETTKSAKIPVVWGYDNGWLDLDDWVYPYFKTGGSKNSFVLSDPKLDDMLEKQRAEFDEAKRRQIGFDIQNYLIDNVAARLDLVHELGRSLRQPYYKNGFRSAWFGQAYLLANVWLDSSDASFQGRPA